MILHQVCSQDLRNLFPNTSPAEVSFVWLVVEI
jgi:hypothetical protein